MKAFKTLLPYLRKYYLWYIAGIISLIITDGAQIYVPGIIKQGVDIVASGDFHIQQMRDPVIKLCITACIIGISRFGWRFFIQGAARRIEYELRDRLFVHLSTLSSTFYSKNKTGDLMSRFTNDMEAIRMASSMAVVSLTDGIFMTALILSILIARDARIALITIAPLPIITVLILFMGKAMGERFKKVQEGFSALSDTVQDSFSGIRVIKTFVQERAFSKLFLDRNKEYVRSNMSLMRIWGTFFPIVAFFSGLTGAIFFFLGGNAVMEGSFTAGDFTAFFSYLQMIIWPMMGMGFSVNMLQRGAVSLGRVNAILSEKPDIVSPPHPVQEKPEGHITFDRLSFTYPGASEPSLKDVSLDIPAGSVVGILGRTGSGKSTLVKCIPRLLDPPHGSLFIDGRDVHAYDLSVLRSSMGTVMQDIFLFSESIRENIAFATPQLPEERVKFLTDVSTLSRDLAYFPQGLSTVIGERGLSLSGGQKQRVALSRALAVDPSILILDDTFSAVDTETENAILQGLKDFFEGRTVILISHRISTLKTADFIVVMEQGRITHSGTHAELLSKSKFYREIYDLQRIEEKIEGRI
ncbi:MAG TPA: ABC transporter ATP-binding protein [Spirochaetia bacterium]|nr:ABC transporter ATP-binding protein [Spirochaetia bacterium]